MPKLCEAVTAVAELKDCENKVPDPDRISAPKAAIAVADNDPDISEAICAELDNVPAAVIPVKLDPSPLKEPV